MRIGMFYEGRGCLGEKVVSDFKGKGELPINNISGGGK